MREYTLYEIRLKMTHSIIATAGDVAKFILSINRGPIEQIKLQKLLYYCQAWSLVWNGYPLFSDRIEAWMNGPVVPSVWAEHRYQHTICETSGNISSLSQDAKTTIQSVFNAYGHLQPWELVHQTHQEEPWLMARRETPSQKPSTIEIDCETIRRYFTEVQSSWDSEKLT